MSALGQKRTCAVQLGMSALPPKADMCSATRYVRFVPIADMVYSCANSRHWQFTPNFATREGPSSSQCSRTRTPPESTAIIAIAHIQTTLGPV